MNDFGMIEVLDAAALASVIGHRRLEGICRALEARVMRECQILDELQRQALIILIEAWILGKGAFGIRLGDEDRAVLVIRFIGAIIQNEHRGKDIRQFSVSLGLGSKDFESVRSSLLRILGHLLSLPEGTDILDVLGFVRYGNPVFVGGPVTIDDRKLPANPYLAIAPERVADLRSDVSARYLLFIENLQSFHRQVREVRDHGIVVFTGGFPSPAVLSCIRSLVAGGLPAWHWGDIDAGGVTIFRRIEAEIGVQLRPHLMSTRLASRGAPMKPDRRLSAIAQSDSAIAGLAAWLMGPDARKIEQESLPPESPMPAVPETAI
ncbi:Wadjet anti-phage system protein JetD domain-containing protein [Ferrovibrio sp. MS7]|uniref:Wadjet anti-phage system protein JetD domain-containing protein n=1 Tax=Ferrovibrio plantarum TaxID=3119164 RepID=UPI0031369EEB